MRFFVVFYFFHLAWLSWAFAATAQDEQAFFVHPPAPTVLFQSKDFLPIYPIILGDTLYFSSRRQAPPEENGPACLGRDLFSVKMGSSSSNDEVTQIQISCVLDFKKFGRELWVESWEGISENNPSGLRLDRVNGNRMQPALDDVILDYHSAHIARAASDASSDSTPTEVFTAVDNRLFFVTTFGAAAFHSVLDGFDLKNRKRIFETGAIPLTKWLEGKRTVWLTSDPRGTLWIAAESNGWGTILFGPAKGPFKSIGGTTVQAPDWKTATETQWSVRNPRDLYVTEHGFIVRDGTRKFGENRAVSYYSKAQKSFIRLFFPSPYQVSSLSWDENTLLLVDSLTNRILKLETAGLKKGDEK